MQHKPNEPTHKLLCRHSQGDENIILHRINTRKKNSEVGGHFRTFLLPKLGSHN